MAAVNEASPSNVVDFNMRSAEIKAGNIGCDNINGQNISGNVNHYHGVSRPTGSSEDTVASIISWLSPYSVDYFPLYEKARSQRAEHTGKWFFNMIKYRLWATLGYGRCRNLECVGIPGAGKTTMTAAIIKSLQDSLLAKWGLDIVLYVYFRHDTQATQSIPFVLASLLLQVIKHKRKVSAGIRKFYEDFSSRENVPLAVDVMVALLQSELSGFGRAYIIVDALDEYSLPDYFPSHALVEELQRLNARLLITSRYAVGFLPKTFSTILVSAHADDIRIFVRKHLSGHLATVVARTPGLLEEIVLAVIIKSAGMFIVATLLVSCIPNYRPLTANELRAAVKELPTGIEDTYKMAMTRIQDQDPHLAELGKQALYWVYFSKRRLTVMELRHALSFQRSKAISKDDLIGEDRIRSACAGLISFVKLKDKRKTVECQFSHFTTREFLDKSWQKYFWDAERRITETCVEYLATVVFEVIPSDVTEAANCGPEDTVWPENVKQYCSRHGLDLCTYAVKHLALNTNIVSTLHDMRTSVRKHLLCFFADVTNRTPGLLEEIVGMIIVKSAGIFEIATLLVKFIPKNQAVTADELRAAVKDLPSGIWCIYETEIKRIRDQGPYLAGLGMDALAWVYLSKRPLTLLELQHALSFQRFRTTPGKDVIGENQIAAACGCLITFVNLEDEQKSVVSRVSRSTAREFLDKFQQKYFPDGERQIAETCLGYLAAAVSRVPSDVTNAARQEYYRNTVWRKYCHNHGFALCAYAMRYWADHARAIDEAFDHNASTSFFRHPISPYTADEDTTYVYPAESMTLVLDRYWTLYFARYGLLKFLQKHIDTTFAVQNDDSHKLRINYNDIRSRWGWTPLHLSALGGHLAVVEYLLDRGADVNVLNDDRDSPLHYAVRADSSEVAVVQLLLNRGAVADQPDNWERAPLSYAITPSRPGLPVAPSPDIVRLLLKYEVDIHRISLGDDTPLSLARKSGNPEIKQLLEEYTHTRPLFPQGKFEILDWGSRQMSNLAMPTGDI